MIREICEVPAPCATDGPNESLCKVYTPFPLACGITKALGDARNLSWLEPSHGAGVFLKALADSGVTRDRIRAVDLDRTECPADRLARTSRGVDFISWSSKTTERFDRIVGNPPYIAISQLEQSLRKTAACVTDFDAFPIGSCANTWYAFVVCAIRLLRDGGSLGFVLPSAAEYAEYSSPLKAAIREQFESLEVLRCKRPLFENVQEGTVVVLARGYKRGPLRFRRREFATAEKLIASLENDSSNHLRSCRASTPSENPHSILFSDIADIRLGGVTGDSKFFLLTDEKRMAHSLPLSACTPVVSRARHLSTPIIHKGDWDELRRAGERVWLFNPTAENLQDKHVREYASRTAEKGGCNHSAYKVRTRVPWYRTPLPTEPDGFLSGMSRHGPWISLNKFAALNATNTLYVVKFRPTVSRHQRLLYALSLLSSPVQKQLRKAARRYADGLVKYEPSSIANLRLPAKAEGDVHESTYRDAVSTWLSGRYREARQIADAAFQISQ
jgi:adenine-specific DNA-methyltransferase